MLQVQLCTFNLFSMYVLNTQWATDSYYVYMPAQNGIWGKFYHFWPKNDDEKWSRKTIFEIPPCALWNVLIHFQHYIFEFLHKITHSVVYACMINGTLSQQFHLYSMFCMYIKINICLYQFQYHHILCSTSLLCTYLTCNNHKRAFIEMRAYLHCCGRHLFLLIYLCLFTVCLHIVQMKARLHKFKK